MWCASARWRGRRRSQNSIFGDMQFKIFHESGSEEVVISADEAPEGWNFLGTWYMSQGQAKVMLSDKSNGAMVIADAIKWVKN